MEEKSEARTSSEGEILTLAAVLALGIGAGVALRRLRGELRAERKFTEQVVRRDLALVKVADGIQQRLASVPFKITRKTPGESLVAYRL